MRVHIVAGCLFLPAIVYAQGPQPAFEVASIKLNTSGSTDANAGRVQGNLYTASNATVVQLVRFAFAVQEFQIAGQPGWAMEDRFDITAKLPPGAKPETWPAMVQRLERPMFLHSSSRLPSEAPCRRGVVAFRGEP